MNDKSRQQNPELPVVDLWPKPCPSCKSDTEYWWSYCALCGHHIAAGDPHRSLEDEMTEGLRMSLRDQKIAKLTAALKAMVDRWEPDCDGQDRIMWENANEALAFAADRSPQDTKND